MKDIIIKPIISERSFKEAKEGRYTFLVAKSAGKEVIREGIEKLFQVNVKKVYTSILKRSKTSVVRRIRKTKKLTYKKARVILGKDQKINIFEEETK